MVPNGPNSPLVVKKQPHEAKNQVLDVEKTVYLPFEKNSETLNMLMLHQMRLCLVLQTGGVLGMSFLGIRMNQSEVLVAS